jgi:hypothetical protein
LIDFDEKYGKWFRRKDVPLSYIPVDKKPFNGSADPDSSKHVRFKDENDTN